MLIPLTELIEQHNIRPVGVLHIGAHLAEEISAYYENGVKRTIWIEALPYLMPDLQRIVSNYPDAIAVNACISDVDGQEKEFNISSNDGESSSLFDFGVHAELHPDVTFVDKIKVVTKRIDTLLKENNLSLEGFDFLNIDLQGAELLALKSMGDLLSQFKYAYIEVNRKDTYIGCPHVSEIDEYLAKFGFVGVQERWVDDTWGDKAYIKQIL